MEVNPGYKQTEVGIIPTDWTVEALGPHVEIRSGESPSRFRFECDGVPYFKVDQLNSDSKYLRETPYSIRTNNTVAQGSLIFPKRGASILLNKIRILENDSFMDTNLMTLTPKESIHPEFLYYALTHIELWRIADTTSIPQINNKHIIPLLLALPPTRDEQKAIAAVLSDADARIESQEQLITKKRRLKQSAMQELLTGKKRLPGFGGVGWKKCEIGEAPGDWRVTEIGKIANVKTGPFGSSLHEKDYVDYGTPIITVEHLGERGITRANLPMVSSADRKRLSSYSLEEGDIVFSRVGSVDRNARVSGLEQGWLFSGRLLRLRPSSRDVDTTFLSYHFHSEPFKQRVRTVAVGQTMASLNTQILRGVLVVLPSLTEQTAIAEILSDMDTEIAVLEAMLEKARQLKQGLMQELLTGKVRLV